VSELLNRVEESVRARGLLQAGQGIVVAVSGGLDSMVLLHLLHKLAAKHRWRLTVAHLNHRLRGQSSDADERLVRQTGKRMKLPVVIERAEVRRVAKEQRLSIEMAARALRHGFLARVARRRRAAVVALAHHADDQVELFFLRLLRGSGGEGLAGMKWRSPSPSDAGVEVVRPLLDEPKTALREFASERGIQCREDASNALLDFQRNRVRHELIPLLRRKYQPALGRTVLRVMEIVAAEADFAAEAAREWLGLKSKVQSLKSEVGASLGRLLRAGFDDLPVAVQRRCVQLQLRRLGVEPDYETVERLRMTVGRGLALGPRDTAVRAASGMVRLQVPRRQEFRTDSKVVELKGRAGEVELSGIKIRWRISSRKRSGKPRATAGREWFDADKVGATVRLRHWRPGDRFHPIGMPGSVKLQDFFTNQKVPRDHRRRLVLASTTRGEIFWVEGMRISERFKLTLGTNRCLQWCWEGV